MLDLSTGKDAMEADRGDETSCEKPSLESRGNDSPPVDSPRGRRLISADGEEVERLNQTGPPPEPTGGLPSSSQEVVKPQPAFSSNPSVGALHSVSAMETPTAATSEIEGSSPVVHSSNVDLTSLQETSKDSPKDQDMTTYNSLEENLKPRQTVPAVLPAVQREPTPRSLSPDEASDKNLPKPGRNEGKNRPNRKPNNRHPPKVIVTTTAAPPRSGSKSKHGPLRRGKWTVEEEAYVARVIQDFNSGFLDAPAGTTLRTYLSEKLQCDPMRITKKFTGDACIGKRVFHPAVRSPNNSSAIDKAQTELEALEKRWRRRLEMQQRDSAKKAAAAASGRASHEGGAQAPKNNVVTQTASWLDRAKSVLQEPSSSASADTPDSGYLQSQIQEVQRLIHEGPAIQQTTVGLSTILDHSQDEEDDDEEVEIASPANSDTEPADKRLRTAEDAEALVGFLRSVRASAASGQDV